MSEAETSRLEVQLDRIESKVDTQGTRIGSVEKDVAVLRAEFGPIKNLLWAMITGGLMAFLMSVYTLVTTLKGGK